MKDVHQDDELVDRIERELQSALSVDPSPELFRRVRTRTRAMSPQNPYWRLVWVAPLAAAAIAVVVTLRPGDTFEAALQQARDTAVSTARSGIEEQAVVPAAPPAAAKATHPVVASRPPNTGPGTPEVLIRDEELVAWQGFIAFIERSGPLEIAVPVMADPSPVEPSQVAVLEFEPRTVVSE